MMTAAEGRLSDPAYYKTFGAITFLSNKVKPQYKSHLKIVYIILFYRLFSDDKGWQTQLNKMNAFECDRGYLW